MAGIISARQTGPSQGTEDGAFLPGRRGRGSCQAPVLHFIPFCAAATAISGKRMRRCSSAWILLPFEIYRKRCSNAGREIKVRLKSGRKHRLEPFLSSSFSRRPVLAGIYDLRLTGRATWSLCLIPFNVRGEPPTPCPSGSW